MNNKLNQNKTKTYTDQHFDMKSAKHISKQMYPWEQYFSHIFCIYVIKQEWVNLYHQLLLSSVPV